MFLHSFVSALSLRSLRLCGSLVSANSYRRDAESAEEAQRVSALGQLARMPMS